MEPTEKQIEAAFDLDKQIRDWLPETYRGHRSDFQNGIVDLAAYARAERERAERLAALLREYLADNSRTGACRCYCDLCKRTRAALADAPKEEPK